MKKAIVTVTTRLVVEVKDGFPEMTEDDVENILCDMSYKFSPSDEHNSTGIIFNEKDTEITDWNIKKS